MKKEYQEYLNSKEWKDKREERLQIDNYRCVICKSKYNLQIHHLTYERIKEENILTDLITLCGKCHQERHKDKVEKKEIRKKKHKERPWHKLLKKMKRKNICITELHEQCRPKSILDLILK